MTCTHRKPGRWVLIGPDGARHDELEEVWLDGPSTYEDCGPGRFRCTQCGRVGYYTGLWRDFYEREIPCSESDGGAPDVRGEATKEAPR